MHHGFIAVEGPIGVGKTTLTNLLASQIKDEVHLVHEQVENPFLPDFYKDITGSAFRTQLYFLLSRFDQLKILRQRELFRKKVISDFMFEKDKVFAYLTLADNELMIYEKLYDLLRPEVPEPDLVVYLTADIKTLKRRIAKRGRSFENDIDEGYLAEVSRAYNYYFYHYSRTPLLVVNTDDINFVDNHDDLEDLMQQIDDMERGTRYYVPRH